MNVREEEYLLAIARYGNIRTASEELNISPPALSIFLSNLEKRAGTALFHRVGKQFVPTAAGELYISYARLITGYKQELDAKISDLRNDVTGKVYFGLHPRRTTYIVPMALKTISDRYPNVDVKILESTSKDLFERLISGELDFIIINRTVKNGALEYQELYNDRLVGVLSPTHPLASSGVRIEGETLEWLDLKLFDGERFILQHPTQSSRMYTDMALEYSGAHPGKTLVIENLETASQMAAESLGIAFNILSYTKNFAYTKPVRYYLVGDMKFYITYYIVKRRDRYLPKYANFLIEALRMAVLGN